MRISEKKFLSFLDVQASGETNMFDIPEVIRLANKMNQVILTKKDVIYIMKNYKQLREKWGIGGYNVDIRSF